MINTVIFDLDGLLVDSEIIMYRIYRELVEKYGHTIGAEEYACTYSGKRGSANMENIIRRYKLPLTLEEGLSFVAEKENEYFKKGISLKKGAAELLEFLKEKGCKIMLASSSRRERAEGILRQTGILHYFDGMVFGAEVKRGKPFPDIFLKACEKAGEAPENCLVLEDSEAGVAAAYAAGVKVICVPDMKRPAEEYRAMAAAVAGSLIEVLLFLCEQKK